MPVYTVPLNTVYMCELQLHDLVGVHAKDHTGMNSGTRCCGWSVTHDQIRSVCMHEIGMVEHYDLGLASKCAVGGSIFVQHRNAHTWHDTQDTALLTQPVHPLFLRISQQEHAGAPIKAL